MIVLNTRSNLLKIPQPLIPPLQPHASKDQDEAAVGPNGAGAHLNIHSRSRINRPSHHTSMATLTKVSIFKNSEEIRIEMTLLGSATNKHHMTKRQPTQDPQPKSSYMPQRRYVEARLLPGLTEPRFVFALAGRVPPHVVHEPVEDLHVAVNGDVDLLPPLGVHGQVLGKVPHLFDQQISGTGEVLLQVFGLVTHVDQHVGTAETTAAQIRPVVKLNAAKGRRFPRKMSTRTLAASEVCHSHRLIFSLSSPRQPPFQRSLLPQITERQCEPSYHLICSNYQNAHWELTEDATSKE